MTLSYVDLFSGSGSRKTIKARLTTNHSASSYGQPVVVLPDGGALDLMSWVGCGYKVERATAKEREQLAKIGLG